MTLQIRIEKIITGGQGLARREDGMVVLTRFVLPGETVEVRQVRQHRGHAEADLVRVLEPSPERVTPTCPHYEICGGCDFQHIGDATQLGLKATICGEALQRAGVRIDAEVLLPTLPSPCAYGYRHRIRLKLGPEGELGFYRFQSNRIVSIGECPVATDRLNTALRQLQAAALSELAARGIREIDLLHSPATDCIHALLLPGPGKDSSPARLAGCPGDLPAIQAIWLKTRAGITQLSGAADPEPLRQNFPREICGTAFTLAWPPGSFSQINAAQNARLISLTVRLAGRLNGVRALDLFCGMGNFSIPLALAGAQVTGVEQNDESVAWARSNASAAGCQSAQFIAADVDKVLGMQKSSNSFELIILDPPRQGLGKATATLAGLGARRIISVSCDPATQGRDLARLCAEGYTLRQLHPVDMFPQTHHIETVALLEKN